MIVGADAVNGGLPVPTGVFGRASLTLFVLGRSQPTELDDLPGSRVPVRGFKQLHLALTAHGPFDVLVDHGPRGRVRKMRRLQQLLGHVRSGGCFVVDDLTAVRDTESGQQDDDVIRLTSRLAELVVDADAAGHSADAERDLAATLDAVELGPELLVLRRRGELSVKVRHDELERILRQRSGPRWSRVVRKIPPTTVTSAAIGYHNDERLRMRRYPPTLRVPRLVLREYQQVCARPGMVLTRDGFVLPDTFRLWQDRRPRSTRLVNRSDYFAETPGSEDPTPVLEGQYYYLDTEYPRHFGHLMTEGLGRLWAWPEAKRENPRLKLLVSTLLPYQAELLGAYGIDRDDITTFEGPVRVESLLSAMPAFHIASYVRPDAVAETYERLRRGLPEAASPTSDRVFLTRERGLWRECVNADALEDVFARRGFAIVRPEQYSIPEQAALFREARVVAGYLGSQLYGQVFSADPLQIIGFVNPRYPSNNEYLLATALGHTLHQFWCPERAGSRTKDVTGRPIIPMHQDYEFDFDRDLDALTDLLDGPLG